MRLRLSPFPLFGMFFALKLVVNSGQGASLYIYEAQNPDDLHMSAGNRKLTWLCTCGIILVRCPFPPAEDQIQSIAEDMSMI